MNPLPQRASASAVARAPPAQVRLAGGLLASGGSENASVKWAQRPVEKLAPAGTVVYEEEQDPELACYLWDRKAQRPKARGPAAAVPAAAAPPPVAASSGGGAGTRAPAPPPQRQRLLLQKIMDMGFDEPSARRALISTGWAGVEEAVAVILG